MFLVFFVFYGCFYDIANCFTSEFSPWASWLISQNITPPTRLSSAKAVLRLMVGMPL